MPWRTKWRCLQVGLGGLDEGSELALVLRTDLLDGEDGGGLLVDDRAETGLALDDDVGDAHLAAQGGEEDDELDGVNIVSDDDERRLLGLNESDAVVETVLDEEGLLGVLLPERQLGIPRRPNDYDGPWPEPPSPQQ